MRVTWVKHTLSAKLDELAAESPSIPWLRNREAHWVNPLLPVKVRYLTGSKFLRHATVRELVTHRGGLV